MKLKNLIKSTHIFIFSSSIFLVGCLSETQKSPKNNIKYSACSEIKAIDDFSGKNKWQLKTGKNIVAQKTMSPIMRLDFSKKNFMDKEGKNNWFCVSRKIKPSTIWSDADGIRLELAIDKPRFWFFAMSLKMKDGSIFKLSPITPQRFSEKFKNRTLEFKKFKKVSGKALKLNPLEVNELRISGSANSGAVLFNKISLYRKPENSGWLKLATNSPFKSNIFEHGADAKIIFKQTGTPSLGTKSVSYEIKNYYGEIVNSGVFDLKSDIKEYSVNLHDIDTGYYEIRAFEVNEHGKKNPLSCIKSSGSMPAGMGTFAFMPATVKENIENIKKVGQNTFFGIHNKRYKYGLHKLMGFPWSMDYTRWLYEEGGRKPSRKDGTAAWAKKKMHKNKPYPSWRFAITAFDSTNKFFHIPKWAQASEKKAPGFKKWDDYLAFVKDHVKVHKYLYPHMSPRLYEPTWEINLNSFPYRFKPYFNIEEIVEAYRRVTPAIKEVDPNACIIGPTAHLHDMDWFESLFKAGLLNYIDAVSLHFYCTPPPEESRLPEKLANLRAMIRKYSEKDLPIYNSEAGFKSIVGGVNDLQSHARNLVRYGLILKGERVKVHLAFYIFDYKPLSESNWGICFNLDPRLNHDPKAIAPKPAVAALAVSSHILLGAEPVMQLRWWGKDIWGYVFKKNEKPILVLWDPHKTRKIKAPVGNDAKIRLVNFMGKFFNLKNEDGFAEIEIGPEPVYLLGASPEIYLSDMFSPSYDFGVVPKTLYPGQTSVFNLSKEGVADIKEIHGTGPLNVEKQNSGKISLKVDSDSDSRPIPIFIKYKDSKGKLKRAVKWFLIENAVKIETVKATIEDNFMGISAELTNRSKGALSVKISARTAKSFEIQNKNLTLQPGSVSNAFFPIQKMNGGEFNPAAPLEAELSVLCPGGIRIDKKVKIYFLSAFRKGEKRPDKLYSNTIKVEGIGASGVKDSANVEFFWSKKGLKVIIMSHDDIFYQSISDGWIWREDSIQMAFDTDPDSDFLYDQMTGQLSKKVTSISMASTPEKNLIWRHMTHNKNELPFGDITGSGIEMNFKRNQKALLSVYEFNIPWKEIGLSPRDARKGKRLGISILINDSDGVKTSRKCLSIYDGIKKLKSHRLYGIITLR